MRKREQSAGDDGSTLALKPTGRVNRSLKQKAPVAPQNGDLSPQKLKKNNRVDHGLWSYTHRTRAKTVVDFANNQFFF